MRASRTTSGRPADQTNADVVLGFLNASGRVGRGRSFTLPDAGQVFYVRAVKPRPKPDGGWWVFVTLVTSCVVCGQRFTQEKELRQWRQSLYLTRTCAAHRGEWKTTSEHAWKTSTEIAAMPVKPVPAVRGVKRRGRIENLVLEVIEPLMLAYDDVPAEDLIARVVALLPHPEEGKRDTRRQTTTRAMYNLARERDGPFRVRGGFFTAHGLAEARVYLVDVT